MWRVSVIFFMPNSVLGDPFPVTFDNFDPWIVDSFLYSFILCMAETIQLPHDRLRIILPPNDTITFDLIQFIFTWFDFNYTYGFSLYYFILYNQCESKVLPNV